MSETVDSFIVHVASFVGATTIGIIIGISLVAAVEYWMRTRERRRRNHD